MFVTQCDASDMVIFRAGSRQFAAYSRSVSNVLGESQARQSGIPIRELAEELGMSGDRAERGRSVLLINGGAETTGFAIDELIDIAASRQARPMPQALQGCEGLDVYAGIMTDGTEIILLLDMDKMASRRPLNEI